MKEVDVKQIYDLSKFYVICTALRPGTQLFCTKLEYTYFLPRTPDNEDFNLSIISWHGVDFYIVSIPLQKSHLCHQVVKSLGMKLSDGVPTLFDKKGTHDFPLQGDNVWTLEGQFKGDEHAEVEKIFSNDQSSMINDFAKNTTIQVGTVEDVQNFLKNTVEYRHYTPILAHLFSSDRLRLITQCTLATMPGSSSFGVCAVGDRGIAEVIGLYVIPRARKLGLGTKLFVNALKLLTNRKNVPIHVGLFCEPIKRIVNKMPQDLKRHIVTYGASYDLTQLEQPIIDNRDWFNRKMYENY